MAILLKLKAFQLFLIFIVSALFESGSIVEGTIGALGFGIFIGWIYSIGTSMNELIPYKLRPNGIYFKVSCLFTVVAIIVILIIFGGYSIDQDNYQQYGYWIWVLLPFHFYLIWSLIYIFYFASKALTSVIEGEVVGFGESYRVFFAMWFYPIGVWFIQPAVQKILLKSKTLPPAK